MLFLTREIVGLTDDVAVELKTLVLWLSMRYRTRPSPGDYNAANDQRLWKMTPHAMAAITRQTQPDDLMDYTWDAFRCLDHDVSPMFQENDLDMPDTLSWAKEVFQQQFTSAIVQNEDYDPEKHSFT
ncbi:hypothetical protein LQW54_001481 [Pestalotiopsis sp. IQ-011]